MDRKTKLVELRKKVEVSDNALFAYIILMKRYAHDYSSELLVDLDLGYRKEIRKNEKLKQDYAHALDEYEKESV